MDYKLKIKESGLIYLISIIALLIIATSCSLNNAITGFAVLDENATNETSNESSTTTENATTDATTETAIADDTKEKKEKEEKEAKQEKGPNIGPVWNSNLNEFTVIGTTAIDLSNYFFDEDNDTLVYTSTVPEKISVTIENGIATLVPDGTSFSAAIEFTASDGKKSASKEVSLIVPDRSIAISLEHKQGTAYDINDDGYEATTGVIDLTVENSQFSWDVNKSNLCARWEVYSVESEETTTVCYGSEKCCAFVGLGPTKDSWDEPLYLTYGQYDSTLNNVVSSQVIYVDYGKRDDKPYVDIYYSPWKNLSANYFFASIDFENVCVDTCILEGFSETGYKLIFEIDNAILNLDVLTYSIVEEISNVMVELSVEDSTGLSSGTYQLYKNNEPVTIVEGFVAPDYYDIEVNPADNVVDSLLIENADITKSVAAGIGIDNVSREILLESVDVKKRYAVDISGLEFGNAKLTATAAANSLFKCKLWDYDSEVCFGAWEKIKDLVAGEKYELTLTANDPGFIEGNSNITITPANITNVTELALIKDILNITIVTNKNATIILNEYFSSIDESTVFTYFEQDNISIVFENGVATIVPPADFIGTSYTYITATKGTDFVVSNVFSINVVNATEITNITANITANITPNLIFKKRDFKLDEDIDVDFEYLTKQGLINENKWKEEYEVYEEETEKTKQELELLKQKVIKKEKQFKKWQTVNESIEVIVIDSGGTLKDINVEIGELREGKFGIKIPKQRAFKAGKYTLKIDLTRDGVAYSQEQDFTWGVLAINVNKSIYLPKEDSFIGIGVLDDQGRIVCNADVTLEITNPLNQKTALTTANGDIKISPECQVLGVTELPDYYTAYSVDGIGTYLMNLTAVTANGERSILDNFTVQSSVAFDVARKSATRVYPKAVYAMKIPIIANQNYNGIINEYVPAGFEISEVEFIEVKEQSKSSEITLSAVEDIKIDKNLIEKIETKENKNGSHSLAIAPRQTLLSTRTNSIKQNLFKYLSVNESVLTELGSHSLAIAADSGSAVLPEHAGSNFFPKGMKFPPPASNKVNALNEKLGQMRVSGGMRKLAFARLATRTRSQLTEKSNQNIINNIADFFTLLPSAIAQSSPTTISTVGDTKIISINSNLKKGSKYVLSYKFDAPDTSPEFYLLGPLQIGSFKEARQWQIANDADTPYKIFSEGFESGLEVVTAQTCDGTPDCAQIGSFNNCNSGTSSDYIFCSSSDTSPDMSVTGSRGFIAEDWDGGSVTATNGIWYNFNPSIACGGSQCDYITVSGFFWDGGLDSGENCWITEQIGAGTPAAIITVSLNYPASYVLNASNLTDTASTNSSVRIMCKMNAATDDVYIDDINITGYKLPADNTKPRINASLDDSRPVRGQIVNMTANVSDNQLLSTCNFFMNGTADGSFIILNKTVTGTDDQCSQNFTIDLPRNSIINFTVRVNDAQANFNISVNSSTGAYVIGQIVRVRQKADVSGGSWNNLTAQACNQENDQAVKGTFDLACDTTYPGTCASGINGVSCNDGTELETFQSSSTGSDWGGINISAYNDLITNCEDIAIVNLCYEWWSPSGSVQSCDISIDADGGASYTAVTSTCPGTTADPGVTCTDITSLEAWTCGNFLGETGTRAMAKANGQKSGGGGAKTLTVDALWFNVTYRSTALPPDTTPPVINGTLNNTAPQQGFVVNATYNATDVGGGLDTCIFLMNGTADGRFIVLNYTFPTKVAKNKCSQNWTIDLAAGSVINFTAIVNDTSTETAGGNKKQNETIITVAATPDTTAPVANASLNKSLTAIRINDVINITANATDVGGGLDTCQFFYNGTSGGSKIILNKTLGGATTGQCSQNWTVSLGRGNVINFSVVVNDTSTATAGGNVKLNDKIITVANTPPPAPSSIAYTAPATAYTGSVLTCSATGGSDDDGDSLTAYYTFKDSDDSTVLQAESTTATFDCATAGCNRDDTIYCHARYNDGTDYGNEGASATKSISDTIASVSIGINNTAPKINQVVNVSSNATDADALDWCLIKTNQTGAFVNNTFDLSGTTGFCSDPITITVSAGNVVNFTIEINDTVGTPIYQNSTKVTVANSPPSFTLTSITPDPARTDQELTGSTSGYSDADGDGESGSTYKWYKNDAVIGGETTTSLASSNFVKNDAIKFEATPSDGTDFGSPVNSTALTISDTVANVTIGINNTAPKINEVVNVSSNMSDSDTVDWCLIKTNQTGAFVNNTFEIQATKGFCSDSITITVSAGNVVNFTIEINDTVGDIIYRNSTKVTVAVTPDNTAPVVNTSFNVSSPVVNDVINFSGNITDNVQLLSANITYNMSGIVTYANYTISGTSASIHNITTLTCTETCVINFTMYATDTSNNVKQNSTLLVVADRTAPVVNTSFNVSSPVVNDVINFSGNITDGVGLLTVNITYNQSGVITYANYTVSGTSAQVHNITTITCGAGCVINFTMYATDTSNNVKQNSTLLTVADRTAPIVNTSFNVTNALFDSVINFSGNITDETGLVSANITYNMSGVITYANYTISGASAQIHNVTAITGCVETCVINFTMYATDTSNNVKQNSTLLVVADRTAPIVNTSLNKSLTNINQNDIINVTANVTDGVGLSFCQFIDNQSLPNGAKTFFNKTVAGTNDQCSQNYTISLATGNVINFTVVVNDTRNNRRMNDTIITVVSAADAPIIKLNNASFSVDPIAGGNSIILLSFNVTDSQGVATINASKAIVNLTLGTPNIAQFRFNISDQGGILGTCGNHTESSIMVINCTISMRYYDNNSANWVINVSVQDASGQIGRNDSVTFTYNQLAAFSVIARGVGEGANLNFSTLFLNDQNIQAKAPILLNNTGNNDFDQINITGAALIGGNGETIAASSFFVNTTNGTAGNGLPLSNLPQVIPFGDSSTSNAALMHGPGAVGDSPYVGTADSLTKGNQTLIFWVDVPSSGLSAQTYNNTWNLTVVDLS